MNTIWKTETKCLGENTGFKSEYEMETFLMLNPDVVGCVVEDGEHPSLSQQIHIEKKYKKNGRIDMIGIGEKESEEGSGEKVLKIFELKNGEIDKKAIDQLSGYMEAIKDKKGKARSTIKVVLKHSFSCIDNEIDILIEGAEGVLVGTSFKYDKTNISAIEAKEFKVIKLMRFAGVRGAQYIILEDVVGNTVKIGQGKKFSWEELIDNQVYKLKEQVLPKYWSSIENGKIFVKNGYYELFTQIVNDGEKATLSDFSTSDSTFYIIYDNDNIVKVYLRKERFDVHIYCDESLEDLGFQRNSGGKYKYGCRLEYGNNEERKQKANIKNAIIRAMKNRSS